MWQQYVEIAVLNNNTSYQARIGCKPSRVFHGRVPYNVFDFQIGIRPQKPSMPHSQIAQGVLQRTEMIFQNICKNAIQDYNENKAYYDKKANFSKFKERDYVYVLQPKADHPDSQILFTDFRWFRT